MLVIAAGMCPGAKVYSWSGKEKKYVLGQAAVRLMYLCFLTRPTPKGKDEDKKAILSSFSCHEKKKKKREKSGSGRRMKLDFFM